MAEQLLAYFSEDFEDAHVNALRELTEFMAARRAWTGGSPEFVDDTDDSSGTRPEDEPIRTVGVILPIASGEPGSATPVEDVKAFIEALSEFSRVQQVEFELELDQTYAGSISDGVPDRVVQEGLIATW